MSPSDISLGLIPVDNQGPVSGQPGGTPVQSRLLRQSEVNIRNLVDQKADQYGVPRELAQSVAWMESRYNPHAQSTIWKNGQPMPGAQGVMQLMPATAREMGVKNPFDPEDNIAGGVRYLKQLLDRYNGDPRLTLAAYNAGPGAVDKYGGVPPYKETLNYVNTGVSRMGSAARSATPPATPTAAVQSSGDADLGLIPVDQTAAAPEAPQPPAAPPQAAPAAAGQDADLGLVPVETTVMPPQAQGTNAPGQPSQAAPVVRGAQAFFQGMGGPELLATVKKAYQTRDFSQLMPDAMISQMAPQVISGLRNEPGRIVGELNKAAEQQNMGDVAYHAAGAIPFIGPQVQQVITDVQQGKYPEAVGHGTAVAAQVLGPKILEAAAPAVEATGRFVKAAAPDVAAGTAKAGAGVAISHVPIPEGLKFGMGWQLGKSGIRQVGKGLKKGMEAARNAPEAAPAGAGVPPPPTPTPAPEPASAPGPPETPPAPPEPPKTPGQVYAESQGIDWSKASPNDQLVYEHIARAQENVRAQQPPPQAAPPATPPPAAPPPQPAPEVPAVPEAPTRTLGEIQSEASRRMANLQDLAKQAAAHSTPELQQQITDELSALRRLHNEQPIPPGSTAPPPAPQVPQTPQQIAQALKAEMEASGTVTPPEPQPSFAETARAKKVDALFDVMTRNKIPRSMVEQFGPKEWDMLAKYAGVNAPSETSIGQLKQRLADYEKAQTIPVTRTTTPTEAQTAFEQARTARARRLGPPPIR